MSPKNRRHNDGSQDDESSPEPEGQSVLEEPCFVTLNTGGHGIFSRRTRKEIFGEAVDKVFKQFPKASVFFGPEFPKDFGDKFISHANKGTGDWKPMLHKRSDYDSMLFYDAKVWKEIKEPEHINALPRPEPHESCHVRMALLEFIENGAKVLAVCVHGSNNGIGDKEKQKPFKELLQEMIRYAVATKYIVVIGGDFNMDASLFKEIVDNKGKTALKKECRKVEVQAPTDIQGTEREKSGNIDYFVSIEPNKKDEQECPSLSLGPEVKIGFVSKWLHDKINNNKIKKLAHEPVGLVYHIDKGSLLYQLKKQIDESDKRAAASEKKFRELKNSVAQLASLQNSHPERQVATNSRKADAVAIQAQVRPSGVQQLIKDRFDAFVSERVNELERTVEKLSDELEALKGGVASPSGDPPRLSDNYKKRKAVEAKEKSAKKAATGKGTGKDDKGKEPASDGEVVEVADDEDVELVEGEEEEEESGEDGELNNIAHAVMVGTEKQKEKKEKVNQLDACLIPCGVCKKMVKKRGWHMHLKTEHNEKKKTIDHKEYRKQYYKEENYWKGKNQGLSIENIVAILEEKKKGKNKKEKKKEEDCCLKKNTAKGIREDKAPVASGRLPRQGTTNQTAPNPGPKEVSPSAKQQKNANRAQGAPTSDSTGKNPGCSKCRYAKKGCKTCRRPAPNLPQDQQAQTRRQNNGNQPTAVANNSNRANTSKAGVGGQAASEQQAATRTGATEVAVSSDEPINVYSIGEQTIEGSLRLDDNRRSGLVTIRSGGPEGKVVKTAEWAKLIGQGPAWKKVTFTKKRGFEEDMLSYLEGGPEPQGQQAGPNNQSSSESETESSTSEDNDDKKLPNQDVQFKNMADRAMSIAARQGSTLRQMQEMQRKAAARHRATEFQPTAPIDVFSNTDPRIYGRLVFEDATMRSGQITVTSEGDYKNVMSTAEWERHINLGPRLSWKKVTFTKVRGTEENIFSYLKATQPESSSGSETSTSGDDTVKPTSRRDERMEARARARAPHGQDDHHDEANPKFQSPKIFANQARIVAEGQQNPLFATRPEQNAIPNQQLQPEPHQHQQEQADTNQDIDSNSICCRFCKDILQIDPSGHKIEGCPHRWYIKKQPLLEFLGKDMPANITMIDDTREYPENLHDIIKEAWPKLQEWVNGHIKKELEPKMRERMQLLQHSNRDDQDPIEESELLKSLLEQCLVGSQASSSGDRCDNYYLHQNNPNKKLGTIKLLRDELFPEELPKPAAEPSLDGRRQRRPSSHRNAYEGIGYGHRQQQAQEDQGQQREQQQQLPIAPNIINLVSDSDEED